MKLICHRGASLVAPENTFAAAESALDRGAHLIELDVRESADGVLYVLFGADLLEIEADECTQGVIDAARSAGLEIMGYTESDDPQVFRRYHDAGLDYINHDHLDVALAVLGAA